MAYDYGVSSTGNSSLYSSSTRSESPLKELDKNAFLQLLVAELQNQNPLEPMNNQDFINQMAQFTTMEQMNNMSTSLQNFLETMKSTSKIEAASAVGKYAVVEVNDIVLEKGKATNVLFSVETPGNVEITIKDEDGKMVLTEEIGYLEEGLHSYVWGGRDKAGTLKPDGAYTYELSVTDNKGVKTAFGGVEGGIVQAVNFSGDKIYVMIDGIKHPFDSIIEVSEPVDPEENQA